MPYIENHQIGEEARRDAGFTPEELLAIQAAHRSGPLERMRGGTRLLIAALAGAAVVGGYGVYSDGFNNAPPFLGDQAPNPDQTMGAPLVPGATSSPSSKANISPSATATPTATLSALATPTLLNPSASASFKGAPKPPVESSAPVNAGQPTPTEAPTHAPSPSPTRAESCVAPAGTLINCNALPLVAYQNPDYIHHPGVVGSLPSHFTVIVDCQELFGGKKWLEVSNTNVFTQDGYIPANQLTGSAANNAPTC